MDAGIGSVALDMLGFDMVRDVAPGEAVFIDEQGRFYAQACVASARHTPCIFEYVYSRGRLDHRQHLRI